MAFISQAKGYLNHFFNEVNEHSLQTPFLYELYTLVIKSEKLNGNFSEIELLRASLINDDNEISISKMGAGSAVSASTKRKISDIAKHSLTKQKYSALFYRLIKYFNIREIVELGTSFGINTLYLSKFEATKVATFEGCANTANVARTIFEKVGASNVKIVEGDIDKTLSAYLDGGIKPDLFYLDANHSYLPTMHYFDLVLKNKHDQTILILDDIHWSGEMNKAWKQICAHPEVKLSLDLFRCGIVFFKHDLTKQHFHLMY